MSISEINYRVKKEKQIYILLCFFVFSNDGEWAEEWCRKKERESGSGGKVQEGKKRFVAVKGTTEESGYIDLMLMSKCRHHIIANSSFSWWGAWLNPTADKCVVAPVKWLNTCECRDVFTAEMVRVDAEGTVINSELDKELS